MEYSAKTKMTRTIVDPTAWEASEVGSAAESVAMIKGKKGHNTVCSIRSSLFKKNTRGMNMDQYIKGATVNETAPVFKTVIEAGPLQAPFTFDGNASLGYCDYGKVNKKIWTKDILALVHNAVRSELRDLTGLLMSVQKISIQLRIRDFKNIRGWWQVCSGVILDFLDLEMKHIMPWVQHALQNAKTKDAPSEEIIETVPARQKEFRDLVMSISKSFEDLCDKPANNTGKGKQEPPIDKKALLIINSLDAMVSKLCDYMWEQEMRLPPVLTSVYKSEKKEREPIMKQILKHIGKEARKSDIILVLLTRWISDSKVVRSLTKLLVEICDCNYSSLQTQFEVNHAGFIHQLRVKSEI